MWPAIPPPVASIHPQCSVFHLPSTKKDQTQVCVTPTLDQILHHEIVYATSSSMVSTTAIDCRTCELGAVTSPPRHGCLLASYHLVRASVPTPVQPAFPFVSQCGLPYPCLTTYGPGSPSAVSNIWSPLTSSFKGSFALAYTLTLRLIPTPLHHFMTSRFFDDDPILYLSSFTRMYSTKEP